MENKRLPIEDVEEIIIDDEFDDDENEVCVRVLTDGIYKEG